MTPLERAARALCKRNCGADDNWPIWFNDARAVLLAIREPSNEMIDAGRDVGPAAPYGLHEVRERWETMIDKALEEG